MEQSECLEDLKRWSAQAARWRGVVEQLQKKAEQELEQGGAPLATIQVHDEMDVTMLQRRQPFDGLWY